MAGLRRSKRQQALLGGGAGLVAQAAVQRCCSAPL